MWPGEAPHVVHYPDAEYFGSNFKELYWTQSFNSSHGWARHIFQGDLKDDDGVLMEREIRAVAANTMPLNFYIVRNTKQAVPGPLQYHFVIGWHITTERKSPPKLEVITAPLLAKTDLEVKQRHFWRPSLDQMVGEIIRNDHTYLKIFNETVEQCLPVPEFVRLRQTALTDWQFIRSAILPRARSKTNPKKAGYEIFAPDGKEVWFCSQGYRYNAYEPQDGQFITSVEDNESWSVMDLGGAGYDGLGYDHYRKVDIEISERGASTVTGVRSEWVPYQTIAGLESWVRAHAQQIAQKVYGFSVHLRGDVEFRGPAIIKVKAPRATRDGFVSAVRHQIRRGTYMMEVLAESTNFVAG